jgi:hypothetical protein
VVSDATCDSPADAAAARQGAAGEDQTQWPLASAGHPLRGRRGRPLPRPDGRPYRTTPSGGGRGCAVRAARWPGGAWGARGGGDAALQP